MARLGLNYWIAMAGAAVVVAVIAMLAERLVWGVTDGGCDARHVTLLRAAFRVSTEGEWVDADEAPQSLDDSAAARIVVAHPLPVINIWPCRR